MNRQLLDLYSDYLISSFGQTTATGLSPLLDSDLSHDKITRFLAERAYTSKDLWKMVKPIVRQIASDDAVLIADDTIQEKAHNDENDLICWHYDHCAGRNAKGINLLNALYYSGGQSIPVAFELIRKTEVFHDPFTGKEKRRSQVTKNELMRQMLKVCSSNGLEYRYTLMDNWFSSAENMQFIVLELGRHFISAFKSSLVQ